MTKSQSDGMSSKKKFASIANIISNVQFFPGEANADIETLRTEIWRELNPGAPYEEYLAEEVIQRILESKRLRELRQTLLDTAFKTKACSVLGLQLHDTRDGSEESEIYDRIISEARDAKFIEALDAKLADYGASLNSIQLSAYKSISDDLDVMDKRLDVLEKKLRHLRQSLHDIQAGRRKEPSRAAS